MTVRLGVSENEWCRHNKDMEPQRTGSVSPIDTRKRNRTLGPRKTTLGARVHVQPVGLNAEAKKDRHQPEGEIFLLTFPFIGLVRRRRLSELRLSIFAKSMLTSSSLYSLKRY